MTCTKCGKEAQPKPGESLPAGWIWKNDDAVCSTCKLEGRPWTYAQPTIA